MEDTPNSTGLLELAEAPHRPRHRHILIAVAVTVATALTISVTALFALRDNQDTAPSGPAAVPSPRVTGLVTTTPTQPSAADDLAAFLSAAATLDKQLQDAAAAINAAGPPWTDVDPEVADLVKEAELAPVARAIPAGLPPDLLQSVILVYSDLASRRGAMGGFESNPPSGWLGTLLSELGNGHAAAARFDADLAATRSLAAASPPIAAVPADSRLVAENLLLVQEVNKDNFCDARGGAVFTSLPEIIWEVPAGGVPGVPDADGILRFPEWGEGYLAFTADFGADGTWDVQIIAC